MDLVIKLLDVGDLVGLKSGSPPMTVTGVKGEDITCTYFMPDGAHFDTFPKVCLVQLKPEDLNRMVQAQRGRA